MTDQARKTGKTAQVMLDHAERTATIDAVRIDVSDRTFDLLAALLCASPQTVSKAALAEAVWPGEQVSDERLSQRISLLRKALRDAGISTVQVLNDRGRGYSLVGAKEASHMDEGGSHPSPARPALSGWRLGPILAGAALVVLASMTVLLVLDDEAGPPVLIDRTTGDIRVSFPEGKELQNPAIAEVDGRKVLIETVFNAEDISTTPQIVPIICRLAQDRSQFASPPDRQLTRQLDQTSRSEMCASQDFGSVDRHEEGASPLRFQASGNQPRHAD